MSIMTSSQSFVRMYENVLFSDMEAFNITDEAVRIGIDSMAHVYRPETVSLSSNRSVVADYNDPAHRCAYLHKFAALHTAMVRDMIAEAIAADHDYFRNLLFSENCFKICSLGGGPGSDVIGALAAFHEAFSYFNSAATVVDYMFEWSKSFHSIMQELSFGPYGSFGAQLSGMPWRYFGANLLKTLTPEVTEALGTASLVTMIKFASAAACQDTERMMKNIFSAMKPGAVVLFIDNSGGGFHKIFDDAAYRCKFFSVFGPIMHKSYFNPSLTRMRKFGKVSCCKTTVTVHMLQKPRYVFPSHLTPLLASPLTPMLYRTDDQPFMSMKPPLLASPHTPMLRADDITEDEYIGNPGSVSPIELPLSPNNMPVPSCIATPLHANIINSPLYSRTRSPASTPGTQSRKRNGCLPLNHFRRHLARRMTQFKAHAKKVAFQFKKKNKSKPHPIFNI